MSGRITRNVTVILEQMTEGIRPEVIAAQYGVKVQSICNHFARSGNPGAALYFSAGTWIEQRNATAVEEAEHLLKGGDHPSRIAPRLGFTVGGLTKHLERQGRYDLAAPFQSWQEEINPRKDRKRVAA